jgi:hypothetical protein
MTAHSHAAALSAGKEGYMANTLPKLLEHLAEVLANKPFMVCGAREALGAFCDILSNNIGFFHSSFREMIPISPNAPALPLHPAAVSGAA